MGVIALIETSEQELRSLRLRYCRSVRPRREKRNYSLRDVARRAGVSPAFLSLVERGKTMPSTDTMRMIDNALHGGTV